MQAHVIADRTHCAHKDRFTYLHCPVLWCAEYSHYKEQSIKFATVQSLNWSRRVYSHCTKLKVQYLSIHTTEGNRKLHMEAKLINLLTHYNQSLHVLS